jgi:hypothetical protein
MIIPPHRNDQLTNSGLATELYFQWMQQVSALSSFSGNGSPEGVINAPLKSSYLNMTGTTGSLFYFKVLPDIAGDTKKGWVAV